MYMARCKNIKTEHISKTFTDNIFDLFSGTIHWKTQYFPNFNQSGLNLTRGNPAQSPREFSAADKLVFHSVK